MTKQPLIIRHLNSQAYLPTWQAMRMFTDNRDENTVDELWLLEHPPVFTQGQAGKPEHILNAHEIPIVQTDRGGQVTYHGPGQLMIYTLFDIRRLKLDIRTFVCRLETSVIELLKQFNVHATGKRDAPGVYVNGVAKIASIGLRVRHGCSYHGLALNVDMDLTPFTYINPCGFTKLTMTQIRDYAPSINVNTVAQQICSYIQANFGYTEAHVKQDLPAGV